MSASAGSLAGYAIQGTYGLLILVAASGWGFLLCRLARSGPRDLGQRVAIGLAGLVIAGGVLEVSRTISRPAIFLLVGVGLVGALVSIASYRTARAAANETTHGRSAVEVGLLAAVMLVGGLQYCGAVSAGRHPGEVSAGNFNNHDDFHAYIVFPRKMLDTGSQGVDPFSERRLTSGLGGKSFLDAIVLAALSERNLHLVDPGIGLLALALGFLAWAREVRVRREFALAAVLLSVAVPPPVVNITAVTVTAALYFALAREGPLGSAPVAAERTGRANGVSHVVIVAILIAGMASLKTTALVPAALLGSVSLAFYPGTPLRRVARIVGGGVAAIGLMAPWMVSLQRSSGTLLFPFLGRGVRGPAPDPTTLPLHPFDLIGTDSMSRRGVAAFAVLVVAWALIESRVGRRRDRAFVACTLLTVFAMAVGLRGVDLYRHAYSVIFPTLMVMLVGIGTTALDVLTKRRNAGAPARRREIGGVALGTFGVLALVALFARDAAQRHAAALAAVRFGASGGVLDGAEERNAIRSLQAQVPPGATIVARLTKPYLLDFGRNLVLINDWPGGASPAPGLPSFRGADALGRYLTSLGIRYLAYSYRDEAGYPAAEFTERLAATTPEWIRNQTRYTLDFQESARALGDSRRRVADDGATFVIDLCVTPAGKPAETGGRCSRAANFGSY